MEEFETFYQETKNEEYFFYCYIELNLNNRSNLYDFYFDTEKQKISNNSIKNDFLGFLKIDNQIGNSKNSNFLENLQKINPDLKINNLKVKEIVNFLNTSKKNSRELQENENLYGGILEKCDLMSDKIEIFYKVRIYCNEIVKKKRKLEKNEFDDLKKGLKCLKEHWLEILNFKKLCDTLIRDSIILDKESSFLKQKQNMIENYKL